MPARRRSFEEQPLSDKTLSRFRKRCYTYELATGTDLIYETITGLSGEMAKIMKKMDRSSVWIPSWSLPISSV